ncbi:hypothetical protein GBA52_008204 [Prunus armeniaca]|nr:hypothetical protein GBA52_008204 [Prunus armeniaca]
MLLVRFPSRRRRLLRSSSNSSRMPSTSTSSLLRPLIATATPASTNDSEPLIARTVQGFFEKNVAVSLKICGKAEEEPKAEVAAAEEPKAAEEAKDEEKPKEEAKEEEKPKEEEDKPKWKKKRSQLRQWLKFPECIISPKFIKARKSNFLAPYH